MIGGRYRRGRVIGRGGMGEVFLAEDTVLDREVAVKHIVKTDEDHATATQRLLREARSAARIHHSNVVAVHDLVVEGNDAYIVMEYVAAENLAQVLRRGPISPERAARIGAQVAHALAAAHRLGIVHRDVKPSNILLDGDDHAKLTDFGVARTSGDTGLTRTGHMIGSVAYMPPEIARGAAATPASDLYSLGATLFTAIEGHSPFAGQGDSSTSVAMLVRLVTETAPRATKAGPLTDLIARLLSPEPEARPSATEVAAGLRSASGGAPSAVPAASVPDEEESRIATLIRPPLLPVVAQAAPAADEEVADEEVAARTDRSRPDPAPASGPSPVDDRTVLRQPAPATPVTEAPPAAAKVEPPASARPGGPLPTAPSPTPNQKKNGRRRKVLAVATPLVTLTALGVAVFANGAGGTQEATTSVPTSHGLPTPAGDVSSIQDPSPSPTKFSYKTYATDTVSAACTAPFSDIEARANGGVLAVWVTLDKKLGENEVILVTVYTDDHEFVVWVDPEGPYELYNLTDDKWVGAVFADVDCSKIYAGIPVKKLKPTSPVGVNAELWRVYDDDDNLEGVGTCGENLIVK